MGEVTGLGRFPSSPPCYLEGSSASVHRVRLAGFSDLVNCLSKVQCLNALRKFTFETQLLLCAQVHSSLLARAYKYCIWGGLRHALVQDKAV